MVHVVLGGKSGFTKLILGRPMYMLKEIKIKLYGVNSNYDLIKCCSFILGIV
jgi:hypothetical protein